MKNIRIIAMLLFVLIAMPVFLFGETECTNRPECWPENSSMHTGLLLAEKQKAIEKPLANEHEELVKLVSGSTSSDGKFGTNDRLIAALRDQQLAWLEYRNDECKLIGTLTGAGGTWPSTYAKRCELNLTEQRLFQVRSAIRCIQKIPNKQRLYEQNDCLKRLAPLANR